MVTYRLKFTKEGLFEDVVVKTKLEIHFKTLYTKLIKISFNIHLTPCFLGYTKPDGFF